MCIYIYIYTQKTFIYIHIYNIYIYIFFLHEAALHEIVKTVNRDLKVRELCMELPCGMDVGQIGKSFNKVSRQRVPLRTRAPKQKWERDLLYVSTILMGICT